MSDEEKLVYAPPPGGKAHELAKHRDTKKLHILKGVNKIPCQQGIATAICGTVGRFSDSHYMREKLMVLEHNRSEICWECMDVLRRLRLSRYQRQGKAVDAVSDIETEDKIVSIKDKITEHAQKREYIERKK